MAELGTFGGATVRDAFCLSAAAAVALPGAAGRFAGVLNS